MPPARDAEEIGAEINIESAVPLVAAHPDCDTIRETLAEIASDHGLRGAVSIILADDEKLRRLNRDFRSVDRATDVLSFDLKDDLAGGEVGEVYISLDRARTQARSASGNLMDEVARLAIHGFLHLAGYDHDTDIEGLRMQRQEARYRVRFKMKGA
jgi:probable rRNA maturation factor